MGQPEKLMERVAAADPLPDVEQLSAEEQREADALLTRLREERGRTPIPDRRPRGRRPLLVALAAACAGLATVAAIDLIDSDSSGPGVVDRAVAAVS
jgi:hypothetical protein